MTPALRDGRRPILSAAARRLCAALVLAGAAAFLHGVLLGDPLRAWRTLLVNFLFFTGLAHAGVALSALLQVTSARWARPLKRPIEAASAFLPVSGLLLAILLIGLPAWAPWTDEPADARRGWLDLPLFAVRESAAFLLLSGLCLAYVRCSVRPDVGLLDETGARRATGFARRLIRNWRGVEAERARGQRRRRLLAPLVLIAFGWVQSLVAFDFVVALDPHWYSALAGGYFFTGSLLAGAALLALAAGWGRRPLGLGDHVGRRHMRDAGALLFGVATLWAYLLWSQYLVIWYGDLPEETAFVARRMRGPWAPFTWLALGLAFAAPFAALLGRRMKASASGLSAVALAVLAGIWLERFVLVSPSLRPAGAPAPGFPELLVTAGALGAFVLCCARFLERFPAPPVPDPQYSRAGQDV